ncbi:MAG: ribonuclease P protein component [Rhodocyclaceae bacterium]
MAVVRSSARVAPRAVIASPSEVIDPTGVDERFLGAYRLRKTDEYSSVFAFRQVLKGRYFMIHCRPNESQTARMGVVVAKKLAKRANTRNLVKRIVREQFRRRRAALPSLDLVVRLNARVADATRAMINDDIVTLFARLR